MNGIPEIPLKQLERISPSRFSPLQACQLREIWQSQREVSPLLPGNPSVKIGLIIHKMLELTYKGLIRNENDISAKWEQELSAIEQTMLTSSLEADLVPLSQSYNYEVKKLRCFSLLKNIINGKHDIYSSGTSSIRSETWVETHDKKVGGKIDLIRETPTGIQIVDFKTGRIIDEFLNIVKPNYQIQIKLYGAIYHEAYGSWPTRLTFVGLDRAEVDIELCQDEAMHLLNSAKSLLDSINEKILNNSPEYFASPTPINCNYCNFRPTCLKYWSHRNMDSAWPTDIRGKVINVATSSTGLLKVDIKQTDSIVKVRGLDPKKFHFINSDFREMCLCNLRIDPYPGFYVPTKNTTGYILS